MSNKSFQYKSIRRQTFDADNTSSVFLTYYISPFNLCILIIQFVPEKHEDGGWSLQITKWTMI